MNTPISEADIMERLSFSFNDERRKRDFYGKVY